MNKSDELSKSLRKYRIQTPIYFGITVLLIIMLQISYGGIAILIGFAIALNAGLLVMSTVYLMDVEDELEELRITEIIREERENDRIRDKSTTTD